MNQWLTKRNSIIAGIVFVLVVVLVITVVLQLESELPVISFDYSVEELAERELTPYPTVFAIDWKRAPKEQATAGEYVKNTGYYDVMRVKSPAILYSSRTVGFSFDSKPQSISLYVYDEAGVMIDYKPNMEEYSFVTPSETGTYLYVLEGVWEKGRCGYAFWLTTQ